MRNWLITSDIHVDEFHYQLSAEERLKKYLETAKNILKVYKENNCERLCILGDILNKSVSTPSVLLTWKKMLEIWKDCNIYFIQGQHDFNSKTADIDKTYLALFDSMKYMDGVTEEVEGLRISWKDYNRGSKITPPECDIFLSHVTFGFVKFDASKIKLCIAGDIHKQETYEGGKCYSVGTPIQLHPAEPVQGDVILLNLDEGKFKVDRIQLPIILELKALARVKKLTEVKKIEVPTIESLLEDEDLKLVYSQIDKSNMPLPSNVEFTLNSVKIHNFRSIRDESYNFKDLGKIIFISGKNGDGKSSILEAIYRTFIGYNPKDYQNIHDSDPCSTQVNFDFEGHNYIIYRTIGITQIFEDGKDLTDTIKNKREVDKFIYQKFSFIKLLQYFYVMTDHNFFDCDRIALFTEVFNLHVYNYLSNEAKYLLKTNKSEVNQLDLEIENFKGQADSFLNQFNEVKVKYHQYDDIDENSMQDLKLQLDSIRKRKSDLSNVTYILNNIKSQIINKENVIKLTKSENPNISDKEIEDQLNTWQLIETQESELSKLTSDLKVESNKSQSLNTNLTSIYQSISRIEDIKKSSPICPKCGTKVIPNSEKLDSELTELNNKVTELKSQIKTQNNKVSEIESEIDKIKSNIIQKPQYTKTKLNDLKYVSKRLENLNNELESLKSELNTQTQKYNSIDQSDFDQITTLENNITRISEKLKYKEISDGLNEKYKSSTKMKINKLNEKSNKLAFRSKIEKFIAKFDMKNVDSIPTKILDSITSQLNNPELGLEFKATSTNRSGTEKLDINCYYNGISFDTCSKGEKVMVSMVILQTILESLGNVGLIILDESLSALSENNYNTTCERIKNFNANNILITSHMPGFPYYDSMIDLNNKEVS